VQLAQALEAQSAEETARQATAQAVSDAEAQRPPWVLSGVILGDPPIAIFSQVPNGTGTAVLAAGEEVGGFVVSQIYSDSVVISRDGQVWTLGVTPPWS
jgi:type II secretory pathway component PulC